MSIVSILHPRRCGALLPVIPPCDPCPVGSGFARTVEGLRLAVAANTAAASYRAAYAAAHGLHCPAARAAWQCYAARLAAYNEAVECFRRAAAGVWL